MMFLNVFYETYHKLQLFSENHHEKQYDFVEFVQRIYISILWFVIYVV